MNPEVLKIIDHDRIVKKMVLTLVETGIPAKEAVKFVVDPYGNPKLKKNLTPLCKCGNRHKTQADRAWRHAILGVK